jgi:hypothetical protein
MEVKELKLLPINSSDANIFIKKHHYSGKVVPNSQLHFGVFYQNNLYGVLQYGPSINKHGTINLVKGTKWNSFIELNRMAFTNLLPRNSESRCISVSLNIIRKNYPHIDWVISFADGGQCGNGTIYRASGFKLVGIAENNSVRINPITGEKVHTMQAYHQCITEEFKDWEKVKGFMFKYIYFLNKSKEINLTAKVLPNQAVLTPEKYV